MFLNRKFLYTFAGVVFWAINIIVARLLFSTTTVSPYTVVLWTTLLAIPFWLYILYRRRAHLASLTSKDYCLLVAIGLMNGVLIAIIEIFALQYSSAINYAFLIRTVLIFTIVLAALFLKEKLTLKKVLLMSCMMIGSYLFTLQNHQLELGWGDLFTLTEACLLAFGNNILGKMAVQRLDPQLSAAVSFLIGAVPVSAISLMFGGGRMAQGWLLVVMLTATYILIRQFRFLAQRLVSASYFTIIFSLTPVLVTLLAIPILDETFSLYQLIGGICIVGGGIFVHKLKI